MATSNFWFDHRCVVVTDEDRECENCPQIGDEVYDGRRLLDGGYNDGLLYWAIVISSGYYSDSCIDYVAYYDMEDNRGIQSLIGWYEDYPTKQKLVDAVYHELRHTDLYPQFKRVTKEYLTGFVESVEDGNVEACGDLIDETLEKIEERYVNKMIDGIRAEYGYDELKLVGTFSNGEAVYEEMEA